MGVAGLWDVGHYFVYLNILTMLTCLRFSDQQGKRAL